MGGVQSLCRAEYTDARSSANQEDVVLTPEEVHICYLCAFTLSGEMTGHLRIQYRLMVNIASHCHSN